MKRVSVQWLFYGQKSFNENPNGEPGQGTSQPNGQNQQTQEQQQHDQEFEIKDATGANPTAVYTGPADKDVTTITIPATITKDGK